MDDVSDRIARLSPVKRALLGLQAPYAAERAAVRGAEPIAIVGMSCRFPGGADQPESYWRLLREGRDAISEVPPERWDLDHFYDRDPDAPGKVYTRSGGFLEQVDGFDAAFFNIAPREAAKLDPQQRLLLELTWEALEHAGYAPDGVAGSRTGIFVGISTSDYTLRRVRSGDLLGIDAYDATGNSFSVAAGRLSYFFGLQGPSLAVDTACSSSLVAVHLACQSLRLGECDRALASGVNLMLSPDLTINFCKARMLAADGRCKAFDDAADGYGRGEGGGVVVLRRLSDALRDGDTVLAVVRGSAINQDGRSAGLTAPSGPAQQAVILAALANAGIDAHSVDYVEAHGTGTPLGDPIELQVLGAVLAPQRSDARPLWVGSVKTNFGHLEAAAGIAGLIKTVLALGHAEIPAHLHLRRLNHHIRLDGAPVRVPTELTPWPRGEGPRVAGVSAFGFSGTNAHVVLTQAQTTEAAPAADTHRPHVFMLDAKSEAALRALASRHAANLTDPKASLADVCYTSHVGRARLSHRLAAVAASTSELATILQAFARGERAGDVQTGVWEGARGSLAFVFVGEGCQYPGMGRDLFETQPVFRGALERCDAIVGARRDRRLLSVLYGSEAERQLVHEPAYAGPTLFALEYALAELWRSWGVTPAAVLGEGVGEYAAACVTGAMSLEDSLTLVLERGTLRHSRDRVRMQDAIQALARSRPAAFLEIGPDSTLSELARSCLDNAGSWVPCLGRGDDERAMLAAVAALHTRGVNMDWAGFHRGHARRRVPLPTYPWQRERFWLESEPVPVQRPSSVPEGKPSETPPAVFLERRAPSFGLMFFSSSADSAAEDKYELVIEAAKFADNHGFSSVWVPERHFSRMGYLYPNPAVLHAALARETRHIRLRAGSVVMPLHDPIRVAEEWSVVDNLSRGRVDLSFAAGWHPNDFVFFPARYAERQAETFRGMAVVRQLWRGEAIRGVGGDGAEIEIRTYPAPVQPELPVWVTAAGNPQTFIKAGECGANLLTHLLDQGVEALAEKIALYRRARASSGSDPATGQVTVMLHTFVGDDVERVREEVRAPFCTYLKTLTPLLEGLARSRDRSVDLASLSPAELDDFVNFLFERFFSTRALLGTPETCVPLVERLADIGVNEIACLLDFGPPADRILANLPHLERLLLACGREASPAATNGPRRERLATSRASGGESGSPLREARAEEPRVRGEGVCVEEDATGQDGIGDWLYEMQWEEKPKEAGPPPDGHWLILEDKLGVGEALATRLEEIGCTCRRVLHERDERKDELEVWDWQEGERLEERVRAASAGCRGVVHLWALDGWQGPETTSQTVELEQSIGVESALWVMKGLAGGAGEAKRLWVVTRGAQALGRDGRVSVAQAPLWGLGRTCAMEHPEIWGGLIDLDPAVGTAAAVDVAAELGGGGGADRDAEDQISLRGGQRYVARLARVRPGDGHETPMAKIRTDVSYLITGGAWGLGWEVARWLVDRGARHLVLVGRTRLPERRDWPGLVEGSRVSELAHNLLALEARGAHVEYWSLDVSDQAALRHHLARYTGPKICGVVHAASVWRGADGGTLVRPLIRLDASALREVLRPKVLGSWALHEELSESGLDFFVSFSSGASLLGSAGQGNYAAAGAFQDGLAHHQRGRGQVGVSINLGAVSERGFGATEEGQRVHEYWEARGVGRLTVPEVLRALAWALGQDRAQVGVMKLNWPQLRRSYPELTRHPWTSKLVADIREDGGSPAVTDIRQTLRAATPAHRARLIQAHLSRQVACAIRSPKDDLNPRVPLTHLGLDSLMAIELRNRIEQDIGVVIPVRRFLEEPSIETLTAELVAHFSGADANAGNGTADWETGEL